jgi:hypothetical protein
MKEYVKESAKIIALALVLGLGLQMVQASVGVWNVAPANPPSGNTFAPLNVGNDPQIKEGPLTVNIGSGGTAEPIGLTVLFGKSIFGGKVEIGTTSVPGSFALYDGNQGSGKVLMSDSEGNATWSNVAKVNITCPVGEFLVGISGEGNAVCGVPNVGGGAVQYYFGGMYGAGSTNYTNPFTGAKTCPAKYTAYKVAGMVGVDYDLFYCLGRSDLGAQQIGWFGGLYASPTHPTVAYRTNAVTGTQGCPADYDSKLIHGVSGVDWGLTMCYKMSTNVADKVTDFGGMYGISWTAGGIDVLENPVTGSASCPALYTNRLTYGVPYLDWSIHYCYN